MKRALTDDEIAIWFRDAAVGFLAAAQGLSEIKIQGPEAEKEQERLEGVVKILENCRTPPMARLSGRFQTSPIPKLTPELLEAIGLRSEDISLLAGRLPLIELSPDKALSPGC
jgi:hypothetical protein